MTNNTPPTITFNVSVDTGTPLPTFSYTQNGASSDGIPIVTVAGTSIVYNLTTAGLTFLAPLISDDPNNNIPTTNITVEPTVLTLIDTDTDIEEICLRLVVRDNADTRLVSPDPRIDNRPPN
jgi:hypothetical protein